MVVLLRQVGKGSGPDVTSVLILVASPSRRAKVLGGFFPRDVTHLLNADDAGEIIAPCFDLSRRREDGDAARCAGGFVARRGHAVEIRMNEPEKSAEQTLAGEEIANKVAHVAAFNVLRLKAGGRQPRVHDLGERVGHLHAGPRPIDGKIALPAAENIGHHLTPDRADVFSGDQGELPESRPPRVAIKRASPRPSGEVSLRP